MLNAEEQQSFEEEMEYILNGCQIFSLNLRAEIEPASLQLSANELEFDFGEAESLQPWVQKVRQSQPIPSCAVCDRSLKRCLHLVKCCHLECCAPPSACIVSLCNS